MKKNIWIWNHYATNMFFDEGGRHYSFAKYLLKKEYNPVIFCSNEGHNSDYQVEINEGTYKTDQKNGIKFVFVKTTKYRGNGVSRILNMLSFYLNVNRVATQYAACCGKPDIILASSVHPLTLIAGIKTAKKFGVKCICEIRDLWPEAIFAFNRVKEKSFLGRSLESGEHKIYKKADALIFTKEGDINYLLEKKWDTGQGGDIDLSKAHYINNGVDVSIFNKLFNEKEYHDADLETDKFTVIYVGAIRPVNNVGSIIEAAKLLLKDKDIQFLIFGGGNQEDEIRYRVSSEGIDNVKMKGFVNKQYIPNILSKSSVAILNYSGTLYNWSRGNSSNKLFEYMAAGKPIISTVKMGYSIIDKYKCGVELEGETPEELARAILVIKNMGETEYQQMSENAKRGAEEFDYPVLTDKLLGVIKSLDEG